MYIDIMILDMYRPIYMCVCICIQILYSICTDVYTCVCMCVYMYTDMYDIRYVQPSVYVIQIYRYRYTYPPPPPRASSMWKFLSQQFNSSHSGDNARSLTVMPQDISINFFFFFWSFFLSFLRAAPAAHGGSQARGLISCSRQPTPEPQQRQI